MKGQLGTKITIALLSILVVGLTIFNISFAIYSDKKVNTGIIQFSEQRLNIEVLDETKTINLSPNELTIGAVTTKNLKISNPSTSTSCVFRIWLEFKVDGVLDENYLELVLNENFTKSDDNKFYYNNVLNTNAEISSLQIQFKVNLENEDISNYENKPYSMKLHIEAVQANKEAIQELYENYPTNWFTALSI